MRDVGLWMAGLLIAHHHMNSILRCFVLEVTIFSILLTRFAIGF